LDFRGVNIPQNFQLSSSFAKRFFGNVCDL